MFSHDLHYGLMLAADEVSREGSPMALMGAHILAAVVFSAIGIVVFCICLWVISKLTPFSLRKELEEDQNTAVGIIIGAMIIGVSIIIAAAIHG